MTGLVGIGRLGAAMAERFLGAGFKVTGYDRDPGRCDALAALLGQVARSPADVARDAALVVLSLPDSRAAREVLDEIEPHLRRGAIVIDTTTGDPREMAGFAERLARREAHYLDACVCGSPRQVRDREAVVMCGGEQSAYVACAAPLLATFARHLYHLGPVGSGARMQLVVNLVLGLNRSALAEGLSLARACELDVGAALEVLRAGPAASRAMEANGTKVLQPDFPPAERLSQHLKDVRLILDAGERCGAWLPLTERRRELLERAEAAGLGGAGNTAAGKAVE